jgi:multicomponent Na+:H+ antiporter subunit F
VIWTVCTLVLAASLVPCAGACLRGGLVDRLIGVELAGMLVAQLCVVWAVAIDRTSFVDVGLTVAVLTFGGGLVFARFLERWL